MRNTSSWIRWAAYLGRDPRADAGADNGLQPVGLYGSVDNLVVEEVKLKRWDGTRVPLSIVYQKGLALEGSHPAELICYGDCRVIVSPFYTPFVRALYERGVVLASCHVRGGGELGEALHQAGFQATKPNTWKDFIVFTDYLWWYTNTPAHGSSRARVAVPAAS